MDTDRYSEEDFAKMKEIERTIIEAILPLVSHINPTLALFALIRCARVMLRKGDDESQRLLLPVLDAYMRGKVSLLPGQTSPMLWSPPGSQN